MNNLKENLEKQNRDIRNKMQVLVLAKREFEKDAKFSLGVTKRITTYYPELLYLFKENEGWMSDNIDKELLILKEQLESVNIKIKEQEKEKMPFKAIGVKREDCEILWNRIDPLNLEFSVVGKVFMSTVLKVLIKYLDLEEFKYERVCPYKIIHDRPANNDEKSHIFSIKYVNFDGEIKSQEIIRTDKTFAIENCKFNVFIPDLLEVAKNRNIVTLENNIYRVKENKLSGVCNYYQPILQVDREVFEKEGWTVPKSFENKFMNYKRF